MTDYSKMSDFEISCNVGRKISFADYLLARNEQKNYCNSWADAGSIATKNRISINAHGRHKWLAWKNKGETLTQMADRKNLLSEICDNPCRAICIVFLMMNEGE